MNVEPRGDRERPADDAVIRLVDVRRTYRVGESEVHAVDGVTLTVRRGEFVALMGPSG